MKTIESETEKGFDYTTFAVWRSARSDLLIDLQNKKFVTAEAAESRRHSFRLNGGILADEMGLGKTIERMFVWLYFYITFVSFFSNSVRLDAFESCASRFPRS